MIIVINPKKLKGPKLKTTAGKSFLFKTQKYLAGDLQQNQNSVQPKK